MANSYTEGVASGALSFEEFVWHCVKALPEMASFHGTEGMAPVQVVTCFVRAQNRSIRLEIVRLLQLTDEQVTDRYTQYLEQIRRFDARTVIRNANCREMARTVHQWSPLDPAFNALRDFMLQQLEAAPEPRIESVIPRDKFFVEELRRLVRSLETVHEELERIELQNKLLTKLQACVPRPANASPTQE